MKKFLKKIFTYIFIALFCYLPLTTYELYASFSKKDRGTSSGQFLKLGAGARATAMGDAYTGICEDATAVYWNPAGLNNAMENMISVAHNVWFEGIYYDWASYVMPMKEVVVGIGVQYVSYGELEGMDETGWSTGDYSPRDISVTVSYGRRIEEEIKLGANIKYISSKIKETGMAVAVDAGAQYEMREIPIKAGIVIQNVGSKIKYEEEAETLPTTIKVGAGYMPVKNLLISADIIASRDSEIVIGSGCEYRYEIPYGPTISGRVGYNTRNRETGGLNGLTSGLGFAVNGYEIDYAFVPYGDLGNTHRISVGVKF